MAGVGQQFAVDTLAKDIETAGGQIFYENIARQLVRGGVPNGTEGRVEGVICERADGTFAQYNASKGVVLATGDFSRDKDMTDQVLPVGHRLDRLGAGRHLRLQLRPAAQRSVGPVPWRRSQDGPVGWRGLAEGLPVCPDDPGQLGCFEPAVWLAPWSARSTTRESASATRTWVAPARQCRLCSCPTTVPMPSGAPTTPRMRRRGISLVRLMAMTPFRLRPSSRAGRITWRLVLM